uniref:Ribosomal protein L32 n=1 Tax=Anotrichium furcellatum TaxID=41999 RepID=A0A4D6WKR3_9FLOR|nr:ribosomal protein L32 [Anotrichium furcellatum]
MAVPKKRTSKAKSGKGRWQRKVDDIQKKSISLAKSILTNKSKSFIYEDKSIFELDI